MRKGVTLLAALATALALAVPAGAVRSSRQITIDGMDAAEVIADAFGIKGYTDRPAPRYLEGRGVSLANTPAPRLDDYIRVFIQLDRPSVAEFVGTRAANGQGTSKGLKSGQAAKVEAQQAAFRSSLARFDLTERWSLQYGANGLVVDAKLRDLLDIQALPGVISVAPVTRHTVSNSTSVPWLGTEALWSDGYDGDGITIAVIDTGIDYYHSNFGGSGDPLDYENDDPTTIEAGTFPTAKVVGGTDFVGDNYNASGSNDTPFPDDDPLDCHGHGSHVAGTAAGYGTADIGPGVAKMASLYALKVFGCSGSTDLTSQAIEWAIENDVDVINMSLGSDFGSPFDPSAIASNNAAAAGIIVVASAGNDGNVHYITGSPAVGSDVISVAASIDGGYAVLGITYTVDGGAPISVEAQESSFDPSLDETGAVSGAVVLYDDGVAGATTDDACEPAVNGPDLVGNIALVQRGTCSFVTKVQNAQDAGAIGVIVFNDAARGDALVTMGPATTFTIPSIFIGHTGGQAMADAYTGGALVEATMSNDIEIPKPELADFLAGFSSLGPGGGTTFKPDLSAPGVGITSTNAGTGDGTLTISGTSMASPHVAGAAALLREQYPSMSVDAIKSLLMNSTRDAGDSSTITKQGVGIVQLDVAADLGAYTSPAGVSFGRLNPLTAGSSSETVTVTNFDGVARTYDIAVQPGQTMSGVSVSAPSSVSVPANGSADFDITVTFNPAAMSADGGFHDHRGIDGRVILTNGETLAIGYVAAIDPASAVASASVKKMGQINRLAVTNNSSTLGWIDTFTLVGQGLGEAAAIGVRTNSGLGTVEFGVAGSTPWDANSTRETDIYLDTDQDGSFDYALVAADLGYLTGGDAAGVTVTALFDLVNGGGFLEWFVITDYNDTVQTLLVDRNGPFGFLADGDDTFDYLVATFDTRFGLDGLAVGSVDLKQQADKQVNLAGALPAGAFGTLKLTPADRPTMLITYQNNQVGDQWQIIQLKPPS